MADVIKFHFLFLVPYHEGSRVEVSRSQEAGKYIVVILNLHLMACLRHCLCVMIQNVNRDFGLFLLFLTWNLRKLRRE